VIAVALEQREGQALGSPVVVILMKARILSWVDFNTELTQAGISKIEDRWRSCRAFRIKG
jgi:hypothetical protein